MRHKTRADIRIENHGSIILARPLTRSAREWVEANVTAESWQWFGGALACEPRLVPDLVEGMRGDGLVVE